MFGERLNEWRVKGNPLLSERTLRLFFGNGRFNNGFEVLD